MRRAALHQLHLSWCSATPPLSKRVRTGPSAMHPDRGEVAAGAPPARRRRPKELRERIWRTPLHPAVRSFSIDRRAANQHWESHGRAARVHPARGGPVADRGRVAGKCRRPGRCGEHGTRSPRCSAPRRRSRRARASEAPGGTTGGTSPGCKAQHACSSNRRKLLCTWPCAGPAAGGGGRPCPGACRRRWPGARPRKHR